VRIAFVSGSQDTSDALGRCLKFASGHELIWAAFGVEEAARRCALDRPDLVIVDAKLPGACCVEATRLIRRDFPCPVLILGGEGGRSLSKIFEAMSAGAMDVINIPWEGPRGEEKFLAKLSMVASLIGAANLTSPPPPAPPPPVPDEIPFLIALGASTGGPQALASVLGALPASLNAAVVVIQHVDKYFAPGFSRWLGERSSLPVSTAEPGERPARGRVAVASTDDHLILSENGTLRYTPEPEDYPYRPSVDVFFKSLASHWPKPGAAALLTGMGKDGAAGLLALRQKGWHTIAQDKETSMVYSMPKAAADLKAARDILPIGGIAHSLAAAAMRQGTQEPS
jgi:two-component system response regulator WspF